MKKVMIAACALAALGTFAIESSNIVGYETRSVSQDQKVMNGANFVTVGGDALNIGDIKMDDTVVDGGAHIWWWNGETYSDQAHWYTELYADEEGETTLGYAGWGDEDYWMPIEKTFKAGEGFWIQCGVNASVLFANPFYTAE